MTKILAPNKQYTGVSASISFVNGEGSTENPYIIEWFKKHGYEVIESDTYQEEKVKKTKNKKEE